MLCTAVDQNVTTAREQLEKDLYDMKSSLTMANQKENTDNNEEHKEGLKHANEVIINLHKASMYYYLLESNGIQLCYQCR